MSGEKTFEYGGYHFTPVRPFRKDEGDFFAISKRIETDPQLGFSAYPEHRKFQYGYEAFYKAATDKTCDIFRCEENGQIYVPGTNEFFIYHEPTQKKRASIKTALSQRAISQNKSSKRNNHRQAER